MSMKSDKSDESAKAEWDQSYNLAASPNLWGAQPVPFIAKAVEAFKANGAQTAIDIPCGDGRNTVPLVQNLPFVIAADVSLNALQITSKLLDFYHVTNSIVLESDVFATKFIDSQFDAVFCWDLLGHLQNPHLAVNELLRICKLGGLIIGSVFSLGDSTRGKDMIATGQEEYLYADKFYFKFYGEEQVRALLGAVRADMLSLELVTWEEPPHEGYREYAHEHQSWAFTLRKTEVQ
jgi:ubiquinone/menaquinone biosynthesis C-methylase UbiE